MSTNLYEASNQWAQRPSDERFWTVDELLAATQSYRASATVSNNVPWSTLHVEMCSGSEPMLVGRTGKAALLTHHGFEQVCQHASAPAGYLRTLQPQTACTALNETLHAQANGRQAQVLFHKRNDGQYLVRALTSPKYTRVWDCEVADRLGNMVAQGWRVPPARPASSDSRARPATAADISMRGGHSGLSVKVGDMIAPAGLYASDHDLFCFLVNEARTIELPGGRTLARGFFVSNSEVGDRALKLTTFLYDYVCGNHIVWGAEDVREARFVHMGDSLDQRWRIEASRMVKYIDQDTGAERERLEHVFETIIGASKDDVLDKLFAVRSLGIPRKTLDAAYVAAETNNERPTTQFGMVCGLTRVSQDTQYADERVRLDAAAGRLMTMEF